MKTIYIVTGASGFLGNNIIRCIGEEKYDEIRALVLPNENVDSLKGLDCQIYYGDVTDIFSLNAIFTVNKGDLVYVIHCAGIVSIKTKYDSKIHLVNVNGTRNVLKMSELINAKFIYVSSVDAINVHKNEIISEVNSFDKNKLEGAYAKTKAEASAYVLNEARNGKINACIALPSGIIGPYDYGKSHLTQLVMDIASGSLTACVKGAYDFVDVRDVARGIVNMCLYGEKGKCYILSNKIITIEELVDHITEALGKKKIKVVLPMWFAKSVVLLSELYYAILRKKPLYTVHSLKILSTYRQYSNEKAVNEIEFKTRDIKETVNDCIKWMNDNGRLPKSKKK